MGVRTQISHTVDPMDPHEDSACYFSATGRNPLNSPNKPPKDKPQDTIRYKGHRSLQLKSTETLRKQCNASLITEARFALAYPEDTRTLPLSIITSELNSNAFWVAHWWRILLPMQETWAQVTSTCCCSGTKSCPTLCDPMDCSIPGFSPKFHGVCPSSCP